MSDRTEPIEPVRDPILHAQQVQAAQKMAQYAILQESAREELSEWQDLNAFNPLAIARNFQTLEQRRLREKQRQDEADRAEQAGEEGPLPIEKLSEVAEQYSDKNPELHARTLLLLRSRLKREDSTDEIIRKVKEFYPDVALADESLDFLIETSEAGMREQLVQTKEELNQLYGREIKAGRNMGIQARTFSQQGLGSPTALRDLYRNLIANPRDAHTLFQELSGAFQFEKMKIVIDFILHSLGADLKAKGPSISRAELSVILTEMRNLQAILGVYKFFLARMRMLLSGFDRAGVSFPPRITFEVLAKVFMKFIQERYPSVDKAKLMAYQLAFPKELPLQILLFLLFRDAIRQVAPKLFRDDRHRQDMLMCLIQTMEELEEELEEEEEKKEKKKKQNQEQKES